MKKISLLLINITIVILGLTSCSSPVIDDYKATTPTLNLDTFFNGNLTAYGIVLNRNNKMTRRFHVDLKANWQGNKGTINEWFSFDDGEKSTRVWQLTKLADGSYQGTANDVVGIAAGQSKGSALYWRYDLLIPIDGTEYQVTLDDWMFLIDENRLFNKTDILKFGFKVGEVILYIEKNSA
jgi:hypothetical protein